MQNSQLKINRNKRLEPQMPVQYAPKVGPRMSEKLAKLGITTIEDLLHYYPKDWEDRRPFFRLRDAKINKEMTVFGKIKHVQFSETARGFAVIKVLIEDETGELACKWMRKKSYQYDVLAHFRNEFQPGTSLMAYGKIVFDFEGRNMSVIEHEIDKGSGIRSLHMNRIVPIYPLTEGVRPKFLRNLIHTAIQGTKVEDPLPQPIKKSHDLIPLQNALEQIHFPANTFEKKQARNRLAFQELFMIQTVLAIARKRRMVARTQRYEIKKDLLTPFREKCGFEFTHSQKKAIREIFGDLRSDFPMNRLLQGDVGSGKTVVALSAMLLACENGLQTVLMAPTEILAEQHFITIKHFLKSLPVTVGLLTGSSRSGEREKFLGSLKEGKIDIAIGTHALLEKDVQFSKLGLIVIDEQHRFGVKHRLGLTQRKPIPDVLVMTATPIPRTLALGLYGDLDISTIDELPPGRQEIQTVCQTESSAFQTVREHIKKNHQIYIVYPLIDESHRPKTRTEAENNGFYLPAIQETFEPFGLKAAAKEFEKLKNKTFKGIPLGLLHGKMSGKEKEEKMMAFHRGDLSLLIATTVIEVGINIPNATVMMIQNAERFGLSTLHQLRGRVGRGKERSICILVADPKTVEAKRRMDIILKTHNGFELAEADLELRGPGEFFGTSQHGMPPLKIANLTTDRPLVLESQKSAQRWIDQDPDLSRDENRPLRSYLRKHFSKSWHWANIA